MSKICIDQKRDGSRCKKTALPNSDYCFTHSRLRERERAREIEREEREREREQSDSTVAVHEAAHAYIALHEGCSVSEVELDEKRTKVSFPTTLELQPVLEAFDEERMLLKIMDNPKVDVDTQLNVLLAGWAANAVFFPDSGEFQGCEEDIRKACELLIGQPFDLSEIMAWILYRRLVRKMREEPFSKGLRELSYPMRSPSPKHGMDNTLYQMFHAKPVTLLGFLEEKHGTWNLGPFEFHVSDAFGKHFRNFKKSPPSELIRTTVNRVLASRRHVEEILRDSETKEVIYSLARSLTQRRKIRGGDLNKVVHDARQRFRLFSWLKKLPYEALSYLGEVFRYLMRIFGGYLPP